MNFLNKLNSNKFIRNLAEIAETIIKPTSTSLNGGDKIADRLETLEDDKKQIVNNDNILNIDFSENYKHDLHSENLYLIFIDLLAFIYLFFLSYQALKKLKIKLAREDDVKIKLVNGIIFANGIRAISLIIVIILENNSGNSPTAWINYVAHVIPSMFFVSAYMALIYLLADYFYFMKNETNHVVFPTLRIIVVSGYIIIAMIAIISFGSKQFKMFMYQSEFVIGVVYIIVSSMIIYYGQLIGNFFIEKYKYEKDNSFSKVKLFNFYFLIFIKK